MSKNPYCLPKTITPAQFFQEYWQKKPLLIRQGLPQIKDQFTPDDIITLAQQESVSARLIKYTNPSENTECWELINAPLTEKDFSHLPKKWSVLVQNMEQWSPELGALWQSFGFLPQWLRDDIMVSYAPAGGSVGKHYDEYDVFLVQGYGHRRWQLGKWCDPTTEFKPDQPIRIFDDMGEIILDEILEPGDILYVPSRLSHYGVAQDDCLTFSFGLRTPCFTTILTHFQKILHNALPHIDISPFNLPFRFDITTQPLGEITSNSLEKIKKKWLEKFSTSAEFDSLFQHAVALSLSERRYEQLLTEAEYLPEEIDEHLQAGGSLIQDNNNKIMYISATSHIYINGIWIDEINEFETALLKYLSNGNRLDKTMLLQIMDEYQQDNWQIVLDSLCNWLDDGWVLLYD